MADAKSEKESWLNYTTPVFARTFFVANSSVELCGRNFQLEFYSLKLL
jgi:hypothetical protein